MVHILCIYMRTSAGNHLTTHLFVTFWCATENHQVHFHVSLTLGAQNTRNTAVFGASEAKNLGIYDVLCHWYPQVAKSTPSKNTDFQHLL